MTQQSHQEGGYYLTIIEGYFKSAFAELPIRRIPIRSGVDSTGFFILGNEFLFGSILHGDAKNKGVRTHIL